MLAGSGMLASVDTGATGSAGVELTGIAVGMDATGFGDSTYEGVAVVVATGYDGAYDTGLETGTGYEVVVCGYEVAREVMGYDAVGIPATLPPTYRVAIVVDISN